MQVARDGPDAGSIDGDDPAEIRPLFTSNARYYEPAGAVSWDVSMEATRANWRISLQPGDTVSVNVTYDVRKASWYEAMGIMPLAVSETYDPQAKDPFTDDAAVKAMYDQGGILTHGRLPENVDYKADTDLNLPDPRDLKSKKKNVAKTGIAIKGFLFQQGGFSAIEGFPTGLMRPPTIRAGQSVTFTNTDALFDAPEEDQVWHSITSCKAPCNRGSGIGYPLARGPIDFDSGQLGFGSGTSQEVTTGSAVYTTPALTKAGTYTYFCRIHPFMRGSIRVKG
jgi:plastocyanin